MWLVEVPVDDVCMHVQWQGDVGGVHGSSQVGGGQGPPGTGIAGAYGAFGGYGGLGG